MNRSPRFEICRSEDGWWARFRAANGRVVWVTETYQRRRGAETAILLFVDALVCAARPEIIPDQYDGWGSYVWEETTGQRVEVREVDER
jgi:uncharacterized protein YegP (UPF0339 family)